jgi:hypothetical protein
MSTATLQEFTSPARPGCTNCQGTGWDADFDSPCDCDGLAALYRRQGLSTYGYTTPAEPTRPQGNGTGRGTGRVTPTIRPNQYGGNCGRCGCWVAPGAGRIERTANGRWCAYHLDGECRGPLGAEQNAPTAPQTGAKPARLTTTVPAGRYAVENGEGVLAFYVVDKPEQGRWAGWVFVKVQASDYLHPVRGKAAAVVLAKIEADPEGASRAYGRHIGRCGRCGRTLTHEESRAQGIGPECASKGW